MCLLVLGGDPAAWRVSGGHGSIPQCPGEACRELNGSGNARSSCPFVKDKSFKSHRPIRYIARRPICTPLRGMYRDRYISPPGALYNGRDVCPFFVGCVGPLSGKQSRAKDTRPRSLPPPLTRQRKRDRTQCPAYGLRSSTVRAPLGEAQGRCVSRKHGVPPRLALLRAG